MTTTAMKKQIHLALESIENAEILKAVHLILSQELKHKKEIFSQFSVEEFYTRNAQSQKEIKQGKLISQKAIKAKFGLK